MLLRMVIRPTLQELSRYDTRPGLDSHEAQVLLLAIAIQESALAHREQIRGPARSWWQIEPPTANDILSRYSPITPFVREVYPTSRRLNETITHNDNVACAIARGILRLQPGMLPAIGSVDAAWDYYIASWRPGRPRKEKWLENYTEAVRTND